MILRGSFMLKESDCPELS